MGLIPALLILGAVTLAGPAFADDVDLTQLPTAASKKGRTPEEDIKPLFEASCTGCHGEQKQRGDVRLDGLEAVLKGGRDGKVVIAKRSTESPLLIAVSGLEKEAAMPPKRKPGKGGPGGPGGFKMPKPFTPEAMGLIRVWNDEGAN